MVNANAFDIEIDGFDYDTARKGMDFYGRSRYISNHVNQSDLDTFKQKLIRSLAASGTGKVIGKLYVGNQPSRNVIFFPLPFQRLLVICEVEPPITSFLAAFYTSISEMNEVINNYELHIDPSDTRW